MSETEEPPPKVSKTDQLSETTGLSDTTNISGDDSNMTGTTDPDLAEPPAEGTNNFLGSVIPRLSVEGFSMPEGTSQDGMTNSLMPGENAAAEDEQKDMALDTMEMAEDRLQESFEDTGSQEGQEEWLSEGILTDDDFNPAAAEQSDSQNSQMETKHDILAQGDVKIMIKEEKQANTALTAQEIVAESQQNIEDALNTLEGGPEKGVELPDGLDAFLIRKPDVKKKTEVKSENVKEEADDGNDTDELLRMLSEDNNKSKKKLTKTVKDIRNCAKIEPPSSDDDDFVYYEGALAKKVKVAQSFSSKQPTKAKPEDSDKEPNSDDANTLKKMFVKNRSNNSKSTLRNVRPPSFTKKPNVIEKSRKDVPTSTPLRDRSLLKPTSSPPPGATITRLPARPEVKEIRTYSRVKKTTVVKPPTLNPPVSTPKPPLKLKEEVKREETHTRERQEDFEDEQFNMGDNEFDFEFEGGQRMRRPERMDEEVPSDEESHSEDGSLYDELPSSESEDIDDWFQLDIRAEKAGDYLPLLGPKAKELLLEEKSRVSARLANLKQSLSALTDSGKQQAEQVRAATMTLAELDDMLKAS